jgi:D-3-phosphoglycerate dehydrogenase
MSTDKIRVLVAGKIHQAGIDLFKARRDVALTVVDAVTTDAYRPHLADTEAILIRTQPMTAAEIALAPGLRIVSRHGVGYDSVDVAALNARAIPLTTVGDVNSRAVAEHTLMLMLAAARRSVAHHVASISGNWNERNRFDACELDGKNLLIIGLGRIGRRVAELAQAFGMIVTAFDPFMSREQAQALNVTLATELLVALRQADFLSVHLPGGNNPVIGADELSIMKSSAIVVNAARGGIVDEIALDAALRERRIRSAAIDVLVQEPPEPDHPLLSNPHVTISPHNAGLTEECAMRMAVVAAQNILDFFDGRLDTRLTVNASAIGLA